MIKTPSLKKDSRIFIVGGESLLGKGLAGFFKKNKFTDVAIDTELSLNLYDHSKMQSFFKKQRPEYIFITQFNSGGIAKNIKEPASLMYSNLVVQNHVIGLAAQFHVKKLLYLASSCVYPTDSPQPMKERYLFTGPVEKTSQAYAFSKLTGIVMCQAFRQEYGSNFVTAIPATVYGPEDHFNLEDSHVLSALLKKIADAKKKNQPEVVVWGSGKPKREFIYIDDLIEACILIMENYNSEVPVNIGTGKDYSIKTLALLIKQICGYKGKIVFDFSKPDGAMKKILDSGRLRSLGWTSKTTIEEGLLKTYSRLSSNPKI